MKFVKMAELSAAQLSRLKELGERFPTAGNGKIGSDLGSGGSAAFFKYSKGRCFVVKAYEPSFFDEKADLLGRRRMELQRALIENKHYFF